MSLSKNIQVLKYADKEIYILGTAHVSAESVKDVQNAVAEIQPDHICVELCDQRYQAMYDADRWKKLNIFDVFKQKKGLILLVNIAIGAFQRRLAKQLGVKPGAEFQMAIDMAKEKSIPFSLVDRNIQITMKRVWAYLSLIKRAQLFSQIISQLFEQEEIKENDIEKMKEKDILNEVLSDFGKSFPEIKHRLIDERDEYMIKKIRDIDAKKILAVVGAGHSIGMQEKLNQPIAISELEIIPDHRNFMDIIKWILPVLVLIGFYNGYQKYGSGTLDELLIAWIYPNVFAAVLFASIAGAKLLSIIVAGIASPITSLIPLFGAGILSGWVEATLRKPTVDDCENIPNDILDIKSIYKNRFTRVLLVFMMSNLGSALGAYIGIGWMLSILF